MLGLEVILLKLIFKPHGGGLCHTRKETPELPTTTSIELFALLSASAKMDSILHLFPQVDVLQGPSAILALDARAAGSLSVSFITFWRENFWCWEFSKRRKSVQQILESHSRLRPGLWAAP